MRYVELKAIKEANIDFKYRDQLLQIARFPSSERGVTITEMEMAVPIIRKLKEAADGDLLELENAEYDWLQNKIPTWPFQQSHEVFLDFWTDFKTAPREKPRALRAAGE